MCHHSTASLKMLPQYTPVQYLKKIRLNKAKEMIITQNAKAYVAALEVGYQKCVSSSAENVKRYFGVTPAALKVS